MTNKILKVEETTFKKDYPSNKKGVYSLEGYIITTEKGLVLIGISHNQQCCESSGYFSSLDDIYSIVGQNLDKVEIVDECYNKQQLKEYCISDGSCIFVNLKTNKQEVQLTVYNEHNGYYGHQVYISYLDNILEDTWI